MPSEEASPDELRERPVGELLKQLAEETGTLVRQELDLAKAEMAAKSKQAGLGAGMLGGAGLFGLLALGALTACLIAALATATSTWLSALIVTAVYGLIAGALALVGKSRLKHATPPVPEQTQESVKEDVAWAKTRARSART